MIGYRNLKYLLFFIICFAVAISKLYAQDKTIPKALYSAAGIPDSLKVDANSVVRYSMADVKVKGPGKAIIKIHTIITVLNEKANREGLIVLPYNKKFSTVSAFEMHVYNADGELIKKYKKGDLYERAADDDQMLVSDDRIMAIGHTIASYPTTIEMIYEVDNNSLIDLGGWRILDPEQSIQNAYYQISINSDAGFRFSNKNTTIKPQKTTTDKTDNYMWQVSNLKAIKLEDGALPWRVFPEIMFAASDFEFYGIEGNLSTWQNFGKWQQGLNANMGDLSAQRVAEIKQMTANLTTDKDKARFLYQYMQHNMRYVNIKLGIGGLKPLSASFVDQKKYGDCKALSNYMITLLKAVDIPAYYAIVKSGANEEPANPDFPNDPFDHIIVCVPFKGDTTWLECTSSTQPFGKLGSFTENRNALLITEDGGKLANTPKSSVDDNIFSSEVHITLDDEGGAKAQIKILTTGGYRDMYVAISAAKIDEQKQFLMRYLHMKQPSVFEFKDAPDKDGTKEVNIELEYDSFCDIKAGEKQFYRPQVFDLCGMTVPILEKRKTDYYFEHPMQKLCVTTIDLPAGFEAETIPANTSLKFTYGNYDIIFIYNKDKNQVISTAKFVMNTQVIPASKYTELQQYLDSIIRAQNKKLVIRKKA